MMGIMIKEVIPIIAAVDDDFRIRESIASLLESAGYAPLVFSSAEEFLQSGSLATATCVITDIRMPGMDGVDALGGGDEDEKEGAANVKEKGKGEPSQNAKGAAQGGKRIEFTEKESEH